MDERGFHKFTQNEEANIATFFLELSLEMYKTNEVYKLEMQYFFTQWYLISHLLMSCGAIKGENRKYVGMQSWYWCQNCQFCMFVKILTWKLQWKRFPAFRQNFTPKHKSLSILQFGNNNYPWAVFTREFQENDCVSFYSETF